MLRTRIITFFMGGCALIAITLTALSISTVRRWPIVVDVDLGDYFFGIQFYRQRFSFCQWGFHQKPMGNPRPIVPSPIPQETRKEQRWARVTSYEFYQKPGPWNHQHVIAWASYVKGGIPMAINYTSQDGIHKAKDVDEWYESELYDQAVSWMTWRMLTTPRWFPPLLFGAPVLIWLLLVIPRSLRYRRRLTRNQCTNCGYQLLDENPYCPECGRLPERYKSMPPTTKNE